MSWLRLPDFEAGEPELVHDDDGNLTEVLVRCRPIAAEYEWCCFDRKTVKNGTSQGPHERAGQMSDDGMIACQLCGKRWRSLGHHLRKKHDMSADEYRDRFGIRRGEPLTSQAARDAFAASIRRTIDAGGLAEHYAGNADRASRAGRTGQAIRQALQDAGHAVAPGAPKLAKADVEAVIAAIEAGAKVATAVKRSPISYSGFHAALARHPELRERVAKAKSAKVKRPG